VLVGIGTVLRDNPRLTVRQANGPDPLKIVLDSHLRIPDSAALLIESPKRTVILTTPAASPPDRQRLERMGARVLIGRSDALGQVDLEDGLGRLAELGIRSIMAEGGARVITSLLRSQLADRLVICIAPIVLGHGLEAVGDLGVSQLGEALGLTGVHVRRLGDDLILSGDLIGERCNRASGAPVLAASAALPTAYGQFELRAYEVGGVEHPALLLGEPSDEPPPLVRLHSECLTGEAFGSLRCDCGEQLDAGLAMIAAEGRGCLLYLRQEGRGIGLVNKIRAYHLQDGGMDTVEANLALGLPADGRDYGAAAAVLRELGITRVRLITNNPAKLAGLASQGIDIVERVELQPSLNPTNAPYLRTKASKMGHLISLP
jgi:GTP cyclohydrolase II